MPSDVSCGWKRLRFLEDLLASDQPAPFVSTSWSVVGAERDGLGVTLTALFWGAGAGSPDGLCTFP